MVQVSTFELGDARGKFGDIDTADGGFRHPLHTVSAMRCRCSDANEFLVQYFLGVAVISGKKQ